MNKLSCFSTFPQNKLFYQQKYPHWGWFYINKNITQKEKLKKAIFALFNILYYYYY